MLSFQQTMQKLRESKDYKQRISKVAIQHYKAINSNKWHREVIGTLNASK